MELYDVYDFFNTLSSVSAQSIQSVSVSMIPACMQNCALSISVSAALIIEAPANCLSSDHNKEPDTCLDTNDLVKCCSLTIYHALQFGCNGVAVPF
jgi:hypothetical protein